MFLGSFEVTQELVFLLLGDDLAPGNSSLYTCGSRKIFGKAGGLVPVGVVPLVKAFFGDVASVHTVDKGRFSVVTPRSCQENGIWCNTFCTGKIAVAEHKANFLRESVSGSGNISVTPHIKD